MGFAHKENKTHEETVFSAWSEKYRPKHISQGIFPEHIAEFVAQAQHGRLQNVLLYGPPGAGKTTLAHILARRIKASAGHCRIYEFNSSIDRSIGFVRNVLWPISAAVGCTNVVILDECDVLTHDAQTAMRRIVELSKSAVFILTANYREKIISPLLSRMLCIYIEAGRESLRERIVENALSIAEKEGFCLGKKLVHLIYDYAEGDMRKMINTTQILCSTGKLKADTDAVRALEELSGRVPDSVVRRFLAIRSREDAIDFSRCIARMGYPFDVFAACLARHLLDTDDDCYALCKTLVETEYLSRSGSDDIHFLALSLAYASLKRPAGAQAVCDKI